MRLLRILAGLLVLLTFVPGTAYAARGREPAKAGAPQRKAAAKPAKPHAAPRAKGKTKPHAKPTKAPRTARKKKG